MTDPTELEVSWPEYAETLHKSRRFILGGTLVWWAVVLVAALLWPRTWECVATYELLVASKAPADPLDQKGTERRSGISVLDFKKLLSSLEDGGTLRVALGSRLREGELGRLAVGIANHVSPISTNTRNELLRIDKDDIIAAVHLSYRASDARLARDVVDTLAQLTQVCLVTNMGVELISVELATASREASGARLALMDTAETSASLEKNAAEIERLIGRLPLNAAAREVVDTTRGGHRYLPPALQVVGIKAAVAENAHQMRMWERTLRLRELKLQFLRQSLDSLRKTFANTGSSIVSDVPSVLRRELQSLVSREKIGDGDAEYLRADAERLARSLEAARWSCRYIQAPTLRKDPIVPMVLLALLVPLIVLPMVAFVADSWRRNRRVR